MCDGATRDGVTGDGRERRPRPADLPRAGRGWLERRGGLPSSREDAEGVAAELRQLDVEAEVFLADVTDREQIIDSYERVLAALRSDRRAGEQRRVQPVGRLQGSGRPDPRDLGDDPSRQHHWAVPLHPRDRADHEAPGRRPDRQHQLGGRLHADRQQHRLRRLEVGPQPPDPLHGGCAGAGGAGQLRRAGPDGRHPHDHPSRARPRCRTPWPARSSERRPTATTWPTRSSRSPAPTAPPARRSSSTLAASSTDVGARPRLRRIVSRVSRPLGSTACASGRRQGVETLRCCSLIAFHSLPRFLRRHRHARGRLHPRAGCPRPLASAVAAENPERSDRRQRGGGRAVFQAVGFERPRPAPSPIRQLSTLSPPPRPRPRPNRPRSGRRRSARPRSGPAGTRRQGVREDRHRPDGPGDRVPRPARLRLLPRRQQGPQGRRGLDRSSRP